MNMNAGVCLNYLLSGLRTYTSILWHLPRGICAMIAILPIYLTYVVLQYDSLVNLRGYKEYEPPDGKPGPETPLISLFFLLLPPT